MSRQVHRPFSYYLGNFLMLGSVLFVLLIYFPIISVYFSPPSQAQEIVKDQGIYINIPKIGAQAPIITGVDPYNEAEYRQALSHGVAQALGTALPGQPGTIYLFAHSSDYPWNLTRYNTVFLKLGQLNPGDPIYLYDNGQKYSYKVREKKVIWPNDTQYLTNTSRTQLILQTCTPIGTALQRLLVFADPV